MDQPFQGHPRQNEIAIIPSWLATIFHLSRRTLPDHRGTVGVFVDLLLVEPPPLARDLSSLLTSQRNPDPVPEEERVIRPGFVLPIHVKSGLIGVRTA